MKTFDEFAKYYGDLVLNFHNRNGGLQFQHDLGMIFRSIRATYRDLLGHAFKCCQMMEGLSIGIERCELNRMKDSNIEMYVRNYSWLRDRQYKYKLALISDKASVVNSTFSARLVGIELDNVIEKEMLDDMIEHLGYEQDVEGDSRFSNWEWRFSDSRYDELEEKAKKELGLT